MFFKMVIVKNYRSFVFVFFLVLLTGCSSAPKDDYKGVYESKRTTEHSLEVPPDLVSPDSSDALVIPSLSDTGSSYSAYSHSGTTGSLLPKSSAGIRFVRDGGMFWLELESKPEDIWPYVRNFFMDLGFSFVKQEPVNGLLETNWLENRFDVPTGWFASMLGGLFSTGLMDKYRIRLERGDNDKVTRLFITHQGLKESSYGSWAESDYSVKWEPRDPDPELEAEMLQRFLVYRGVAKSSAKQIVSSKKIQRTKLLKDETGKKLRLEVNEIFPRTWRRISIALDRLGIVIEDRNRSKGIYYIRTTENFVKSQSEDKSWLASIFSSSKEELKAAKFQLSVEDLEDKTVIKVLDENGNQDTSKTGHLIIEKLKAHLR